jgi:hypothetical protein
MDSVHPLSRGSAAPGSARFQRAPVALRPSAVLARPTPKRRRMKQAPLTKPTWCRLTLQSNCNDIAS